VRIGPGLPRLEAACAGLGLCGAEGPGGGWILAARVAPGDMAGLAATLAGAAGITRLALAVPSGGTVGEPAPDPAGIAALVRALIAGGWEVRTDRFALPECALTRTVLVEARRTHPLEAAAAAEAEAGAEAGAGALEGVA
jgi:hypothetical protein